MSFLNPLRAEPADVLPDILLQALKELRESPPGPDRDDDLLLLKARLKALEATSDLLDKLSLPFAAFWFSTGAWLASGVAKTHPIAIIVLMGTIGSVSWIGFRWLAYLTAFRAKYTLELIGDLK